MKRVFQHALRGAWRRFWSVMPAGLLPLRLLLSGRARQALGPPPAPVADYAGWIRRHDTLGEADRAAILGHAARLAAQVSLRVVITAEHAGEAAVAMAALRDQLWPGAERCATPQPLADVLARAAPEDWILPLDAATRLAPTAFYEVAAAAVAQPDWRVIYADEDSIDDGGLRQRPFFKPDFDPDRLRGQNYLTGLVAYRADLLREAPAGDAWARALWATAAAGRARVGHIPVVLAHRPLGAAAPIARVAWPLPEPAPLVSIIVPTRDAATLVAACAAGVLHRTDYPAIEFLLLDNGSTEPASLALFGTLRADPRVRILPAPGPFNYAALNNLAAAEARGAVLVLLNNDIDVIGGGWLRELVTLAMRPEVGAVGAKLLYADDTLQHGGVVLGAGGVVDHYRSRRPRDDPGDHGSLALVREVAAVTGACLAIRRAVYQAVGGMDAARFAVAFNDVDLCLRLRAAGYRNLWTPFAELYHLESASRGRELTAAKARRLAGEIAALRQRWGAALLADPFYSPNLSLDTGEGALAEPPRRAKTWAAWLGRDRRPDACI